MKPETYWEKRCLINEMVLRDLMDQIVRYHPYIFESANSLGDAWDPALDKLDDEQKTKEGL